ncbi:MAG TPA: endonuclease/exonuclease/phosphatase family protein [Anaerolineaceae bacterium]|nr:endonuclease/exonuclease/phosphatase family protein [Anaerolineaceae bacterium]HPN51148.1 endonuclease/exonuclease/phosphatase family protein [Anaerolineaceae bacterium]
MSRKWFLLIVLSLALSACQGNPTVTIRTAAPTVKGQPTLLAVQPAAAVVPEPETAIHDIQGAAHHSPMEGKTVENVRGLVTAVRSDGFYIQSATPDEDPSTSEGILVFTESTPKIKIGDAVAVTGTVMEYYSGGEVTGNLSVTEIAKPKFSILSSGNTLPDPVIIGEGGRKPPTQIIDDDVKGSVKNSGIFDPETDGLDFYETFESMRVQVNNAVVVGPTNKYKETVILPNGGKDASLRTPRGGMLLRENDANPEMIVIDDMFMIVPNMKVGDKFTEPLVGIMDYNFGYFKIQVTGRPKTADGGLIRSEAAPAAAEDQLSIASYNLTNFDPLDEALRFELAAEHIVKVMQSPDIIGLQEVQDNDGPANTGKVTAEKTYQMLVDAIKAADGPEYAFVDIAPEDCKDGGETGGNIRVGYLFRTDRGLSFEARAGGDAVSPVEVINNNGAASLSFNPGRIDPTNTAFLDSRKPLAAEFTFKGKQVIVINNHFNSKGGDQPVFGENQPPLLVSEVQRLKQAEVVKTFVGEILAINPDANIVVLGDLNDFGFSKSVQTLISVGLVNLYDLLPEEERYSYLYTGNSQSLDHILVSPHLFQQAKPVFSVLHLNAEFFDTRRLSDHDPLLVRMTLP